MDIVLTRILSLIPKKPDGKFVRGSKKDFATSIGYDSGDIISMWESGASKSYMKKVHEIAAVYNVDPDWLLGKTDKKEKPGIVAELSERDIRILNIIRKLPDDVLDALELDLYRKGLL